MVELKIDMIDVCEVGSCEADASWCLCAPRWEEGLEYGMAPSVDPAVTHESALEFARLGELLEHSAGDAT
jgi:uncharacterized protein (DUF2237 family)